MNKLGWQSEYIYKIVKHDPKQHKCERIVEETSGGGLRQVHEVGFAVESQPQTDHQRDECHEEHVEHHALEAVEAEYACSDASNDQTLRATFIELLHVLGECCRRELIEILLLQNFKFVVPFN